MRRASHMLPGLTMSALLLFAALVLLFLLRSSAEATPQPSHVISGDVTVNNSPANDSLKVEARLGGVSYTDSVRGAGTVITSDGQYGRGNAVDAQVRADDLATGDREGMRDGELFVFYVDDQRATVTVVDPGDFSTCAAILQTIGVDVPVEGEERSNYPFCSGSASRLDLNASAKASGGSAPGPGPSNTAPTAGGQTVTTDEDTPANITLTGSDPDVGSIVTFLLITLPTNGAVSQGATDITSANSILIKNTATSAVLTYTPAPNYGGPDSFTYRVRDNENALSAVAAVSITVTSVSDDPPVADAQNVVTPEDTLLAITLTGSDPDAGDVLTFTVLTQPDNGALTGVAAALTYTPSADFNGEESFIFIVSDGVEATADSAPATVTITVTPVNDAPTANGVSVAAFKNRPKAITLTGNDADGDALTVTIVQPPVNGALIGAPPAVTYTPNPDFLGGDIFTFRVNDGTTDSPAANIVITVSDQVAISEAQTATIETTIEVSEEDREELSAALEEALGVEVDVTSTVTEVTVAEEGKEGLVIDLDVEGLEEGQEIVGELDVTIGDLTLATTNGTGTATLRLDDELSIESEVTLDVGANTLGVAMTNPVLVLEPQALDAESLSGGSDEVKELAVKFKTPLRTLRRGASLQVEVAKEASAFADDDDPDTAITFFQFAAEGAGGTIEDISKDVAVVIRVRKVNIEEGDVGDNTLEIEVSKEWHENRLLEGKAIAFTKRDDEGNVFSVPATCILANLTRMLCTGTFTGEAGGYSSFALIAVRPSVGPIPTPTPTPAPGLETPIATPTARPTIVSPITPAPTATATAMPAPTATPTSTPSPSVADEGASIGLIIGIVAGVVLIIGIGGFFFLRRRGR